MSDNVSALRTQLGHIKAVRIGLGGYQGAMLGVHFTLGGDSWGVGDSWSSWSPSLIKHSEHCSWSEAERRDLIADAFIRLDSLLKAAKVETADQLVGIPIEVTFKNFNVLESWRVLTEVLP